MSTFGFRAVDLAGVPSRGEMDASSKKVVTEQLRPRGLIVLDAAKMDHARRLVDELNQCRLLCPTFGPAYCEMGQIEKFILDRPEGAAHIRKGFELAPHDPGATFVAARLEASEGNWPHLGSVDPRE